MDVVARCVRGVEWVAAAEARGRLAAAVDRIRHREVWLHGPLAPPAWVSLRTVDDVFIRAGVANGVGHTRNDLNVLSRAASRLHWSRAASDAGRSPGAFDVVASFLGKRNYNRFEVEQTVGEQISAQTGWTHRQRRRDQALQGGVSLTARVHIEGGEAVLGIRLADRPMHRRAWKERDTPGTLHPPVAAAMGLVAGLRPGVIVADPFCGSGTIGIEVALDEPTAHTFMSDLGGEAVKTAKHNALVADVASRAVIARADGVLPPLRPSSVDRIVSNTPWGKAVKVEGGFQGGWTSFLAAMAEAVVGDRGRMVLLVDTEEMVALTAAADDVGCSVLDRFQLAVSGMWATMVVLGVAHDAQVIDTGSRFGPELVAELAAHRNEPAVG